MTFSKTVITGLGIVSSVGLGREPFFQSLIDEVSGITSLSNRTDDGAKPGALTQPPGLWIGGPVVHFDAKQFVRPRKALKVMCREIQTAFAASVLAIQDAGLEQVFPLKPQSNADQSDSLEADDLVAADVGTVFGAEMYYGPPVEMLDAYQASCDPSGRFDAAKFGTAAMKNVTPLWMLKYLPNMPACHVGISLGAHGPNNSLVLGDVSGPAAMMEARSCLDRSHAKLMLTGVSGTRINTTRLNYRGDLPIPAVIDPPQLSSRPFDAASQGVVGGEASVSFVLETADRAARRSATPLAEIASISSRFCASPTMANPTRSLSAGVGSGRGSAKAIQASIIAALDDAGLGVEDIGAVVAQACGDVSIDQCERLAIQSSLPGVPVTAPVATVGHTGAAAGAVNVAVAALILKHRRIPATIGLDVASRFPVLVTESMRLEAPAVIALSHTSEGSAIATVLVQP